MHNTLKGVIRCGYCREKVEGIGMPHDGVTYCNKSCRELGIEREAKRKRGWGWLGLIFSLGILMGMSATDLWAQQHHHDFHKDFYRHWMTPDNPNKSCCNARIMTDGVESGDCEPTQAKIIKGDWYAWVRQKKEWLRIDDSKIVRYPNPNIFDAHHCWTPDAGTICFRPPDTGG